MNALIERIRKWFRRKPRRRVTLHDLDCARCQSRFQTSRPGALKQRLCPACRETVHREARKVRHAKS